MEKTMMVTRGFRKDGISFCQNTEVKVNYNPVDGRFYVTNCFGQYTDVSQYVINTHFMVI